MDAVDSAPVPDERLAALALEQRGGEALERLLGRYQRFVLRVLTACGATEAEAQGLTGRCFAAAIARPGEGKFRLRLFDAAVRSVEAPHPLPDTVVPRLAELAEPDRLRVVDRLLLRRTDRTANAGVDPELVAILDKLTGNHGTEAAEDLRRVAEREVLSFPVDVALGAGTPHSTFTCPTCGDMNAFAGKGMLGSPAAKIAAGVLVALVAAVVFLALRGGV
jgi:hypothetical protein